MPMIDLKLSQGAVSQEALPALAEELTALVLRHRRVPDNAEWRRNVWLYVHELPTLVGGAPPAVDVAHVTVTFTVLSGGIDAAGRAALAEEATRAVRAAAAPVSVWTIFEEVPAEDWGADGQLVSMPSA